LSLILIEIKKIFVVEEDLNISSYFAFITIFYIIGKIHSSFSDASTAKKDYKTYIICLLTVFLITFLTFNFEILKKLGMDFEFIKINQNEIMKIVEDRVLKILDTTDNREKMNEISKYSNNFIVFLYFAVFAFAFAVNYNNAKKEAKLDDVLITNVEKNNNLIKYTIQNQTLEKLKQDEKNSNGKDHNNFFKDVHDNINNNSYQQNEQSGSEAELKTLEGIGLICKIKIILRIILAILLFDQLFKNFLTENKLISELMFRVLIVPIFIIIDSILTSKCLKYHCMNFMLGNYFIMLEAIDDPKRINIEAIRFHCNKSLKNFWKFFSTLFINCFLPLIIYFSFLNKADIYYKLQTIDDINIQNFRFFSGFLETILFITYSGFILARCLISIGFFCYYQIFIKNSKIKVI